ncbi:DMT family transporter [Paractinoplanes lichenicola]|uniref:DMT family transporter n=1 Tax=Paractinoplanes lichenicola TaxID=2802976 RepID=A0ABS1VEE3_9ACTN|nr:DMT family transporter [Actinoplanes lichenicola]MBL7253057.1 DMT family transporter [Actinoplanes lichenicola]
MAVISSPVRARSSGLGLAQVCAAGVLWGTGGLAVTVLHERDGLGAMTVSAWRMLLAAVALIGFAALTRRTGTALDLLRRRPGLTVAVGCGTAAYQGLYFVSVLLVGVSVATVVSLGLAPILAAVWEHVRAGTRPAPRQVVVLLAALAGLVLISATAGHGTGGGDSPYLGLTLAVAAGITYAATTVLGHSLARQTDPITLTTCTTTAGALALAPFLLIAAIGREPVLGTSLPSLALLAYLGLATMALAYGLLYAGLRTTSGSAATIATLLEPVAAALLAATLLHERLPWPAIAGGVLILAAVAALRPSS